MMCKEKQAPQIALAPGAHFGQLTEMCDFGGCIVAESHYAPGFTTPWHTHVTASFTVILRGEYVEEHRARSFDCFPGKILFRAAGERHFDRIGSRGAHCVMIEMRPTWQERFGPARPPSSVCHIHDGDHVLLRLRREMTIVDAMTPLVIEALALELCCKLYRVRATPSRMPLWLRRIQEKLEAEFAQRQSLQALAADANVHPAHLARAFRQHFGCSVGEYIRRRRVAFACERIVAREPLSHIALEAGFANQAHFSRTFKAATGFSPGEFRREGCKAGAKNALSVKDASGPSH
jgi:AraC family transcriptional regulator